MFAALKRLADAPTSGVKLPPKLPFVNRNWIKTMQSLEAKIPTLEAEFDKLSAPTPICRQSLWDKLG